MNGLLNWSRTFAYSADRLHSPSSVEQVQDLVRHSTRIGVLGSRHSFNALADSPRELLSLENLADQVSIDRDRGTVTVAGGMRYGHLGKLLHAEGLALPNLASLPHISVAGACATATHGSGRANGSLATAVAAVELVDGTGEVRRLSREHDATFPGVVVGLGALGVVTGVTLDVVPTFGVRQDVYEDLAWTQVLDHFDDIVTSAYSVSLFTDWTGGAVEQVWLKSRVGDADPPAEDFFGATPATVKRHPVPDVPALHCTDQLGVPGPWYDRLPHFRHAFEPSNGDEIQSEYLVPYEHAVASIDALRGLSSRIAPALLVSEIRTVAADDLWMSPFHQQPCVAFHFTWQNAPAEVEAILPELEASLAHFDARPHWGKVFAMAPDRVQARYERLHEFRDLAERLDPEHKFRNGFLDRYVFEDRAELP